MERRVLVAFFLSFLVWYSFQTFFVGPAQPIEQPAPASAGPAAVSPATPIPAPTPEALPPPAETSSRPLVAESSERDIVVEAARLRATFTNRGARLKSLRLKKYLDARREPLEIVVPDIPGTSRPLPFTLSVDDALASETLNRALYKVHGDPTGTTAIAQTLELTFEYRDEDGLHAIKTFRLEPDAYLIGFRTEVTRGDTTFSPRIQWGPGAGGDDVAVSLVQPAGVYAVADDATRLSSSTIASQPTYEEDFQYVGVDNHYFMSVALKPGRARVFYESFPMPAPAGSTQSPGAWIAYSIEPTRAGQWLSYYVGPKDFDQLASIDRGLVRAIDFGMFALIVVPLLRSLNWINGFVGNYGWSIVTLTIIINLIMFPLRHKTVVSMRKMQEIQPEAKAIQDRYAKLKATDPAKQKMNQELMELYRARGANPASGCVPTLLTLPVLFAFYALLQTAIELRGAPFIGWIQDLSKPDAYRVLPVLMGVSQVWQQWIMPATGVDPVQRKMMMIMPVVFTFISFTWASGIILYWFVSTVWGIGQQYLTNYLIGPPNIRTPRPPAERQLKRAGAGKTEAAAQEE
jgi:YidC/Oxa1 family membrane protein insertase